MILVNNAKSFYKDDSSIKLETIHVIENIAKALEFKMKSLITKQKEWCLDSNSAQEP